MLTCAIVAVCLALTGQDALVERTFTGDVLVIDNPKGPDRWVRLVGIGVPGTSDPNKPIPFVGKRDPDALARWLTGRSVTIASDPLLPPSRARFELAYAHAGANRVDVGLRLVRAGYAYVRRDQDFDRREVYLLAEAEARAEGRGFWPPPGSELPQKPKPAPDPVPSVASAPSAAQFEAARAQTAARRSARQARRAAHYPNWVASRSQLLAQAQSYAMSYTSPAPRMMGGGPGTHYVRGHYRGGTWVDGYMRSNPRR